MQKMYNYISAFPDVFKFFPDNREMAKLPKEWIGNVAYSVMGSQFSDWVQDQMEVRNLRLATDDQMIEMDEDVYEAFTQSTAVSCKYSQLFFLFLIQVSVVVANRGVSANMLKVGSKRRRTQAEIKADKEEALLKEQDLQDKLKRLAEYETKMAMFEQMQQENQRAQELLTELHANGQIEIDENGNVSPSKQKPQALD